MPSTSTATKTQTRLGMPSLWHVILHNDDFTPFDFVIELLVVVFGKTPEEGSVIAGHVHTKGKAIVGLYTKEVAETKVNYAMDIAAQYDHPLRLSAEQA